MKCDEARPKCTTCRISGIPCGGYAKQIFFDFEEALDTGESRFRRPLLTEEERESMSREIISSVPPARAMWHIARIDEECERAADSEHFQLFRGPFGAFRIGYGSTSSSIDSAEFEVADKTSLPDSPPPDTGPHLEGDSGHLSEALFTLPDASTFSPRGQSTRLPVADGCNAVDDTMVDWWSMDNWWSLSGPGGSPDWCGDQIQSSSGHDSASKDWTSDLQQPFASSSARDSVIGSGLSLEATQDPICETTSIPPTPDYAIPHDAVFLLKHYSTTVLQSLTPYRHGKTPWHILFIPHAKSCLAAITLGEEMDNTSLCTFFGMLSISAFSLGVISGSERWFAQSELCRDRALGYARSMLRTAYNVPKAAKYKSILVALLTMVQMSSVAGDREQTEYYFLEAEKFIRVKGLNRRKSRKVRLLHHCYAFERMLYETTLSGNVHSPLRRKVRRAIESSGAKEFSRDGLSFKSLAWKNLEEDMRQVKDRINGENDLHLKLPGIWSATLYAEIFGVTEVYVLLLSLIIRLARSKDNDSAASCTAEYLDRAKSLERCIQGLRRQPDRVAVAPQSDPERQNCQRLLDTLATAMQQALTIFFYRKVYDLDPSMLQDNVKIIRDCLWSFEEGSCGAGNGEARLVWPAYVAASEAEDKDVKEEIERWFDSCSRRSGLRMFAGLQLLRRGAGGRVANIPV